jgi:two-component system phosphate regulon sensor histidine kinase PhoR
MPRLTPIAFGTLTALLTALPLEFVRRLDDAARRERASQRVTDGAEAGRSLLNAVRHAARDSHDHVPSAVLADLGQLGVRHELTFLLHRRSGGVLRPTRAPADASGERAAPSPPTSGAARTEAGANPSRSGADELANEPAAPADLPTDRARVERLRGGVVAWRTLDSGPISVIECRLDALPAGSVPGWLRFAAPALAGLAAGTVARWRMLHLEREVNRLAERLDAGESPMESGAESAERSLDPLLEAARARLRRAAGAREVAIRERDELRALVDSIPEGVIGVDADLTIRFANVAAPTVLGLAEPPATGRKLWEVHRVPGLLEATEVAAREGFFHDSEFEISGPSPRSISFHARPLPEGAPFAAAIILEDVTALRRLERMRQEFMANVSHELKTPLSSIRGYAETILEFDDEDPSTIRKFVRRIEEQASRLHALIIDMLTLARIESEAQAFDVRVVDLGRISAACAEGLAESAAAKAITLRFEPAPGPTPITADAEAIATIVRNLIDNAIKYTPERGSVTVRVPIDGRVAAVEVRDSGLGIPRKDLPRVFERFYRVDKARSKAVGGTGLGLSIVKHLTQTFGGSIHVDSRVGVGSTFRISFPLATVPTARSAELTASGEPDRPTVSPVPERETTP